MSEPATSTRAAQHEGPRQPRLTIWGVAALFFLRLRDLPPEEYVIHLDTRHPTRWRWRVAQVGAWERPRQEPAEEA